VISTLKPQSTRGCRQAVVVQSRSAKMQIKKETRVAVGAVAICAAFWMLPLYRAASYLLSLPSLTSGQSINETNDLHYGRELLFSYLACLLSSGFLGWLYVRRPRIMTLAPLLLILGMALRVILLRPEEVIVFFPAIRPYQPAQIGLLAALIGICFYMYSDSRADFDPS
jgi:hypothetical protein